MKKRKLLACPECELFCSVEQNCLDYACPKCGGQIQLVNIDYDAYSSMSEEEKTKVREEYIKKHFKTQKKETPYFESKKESKIAKTIGFFGGVLIALAFVGGAVLLITGGIFAGIAALIGGLTSGGVLYVLSDVAEDVRHIRNQIDWLMFERKNQ